jgi:GNAT superfamily N-acetyltransferase
VKGQHLYVRPIDGSDHEAVDAFLDLCGCPRSLPKTGLLGKLVGDLAAVLLMEIAPSCILIRELVVAAPLRRKRVGRVMIDELAQLAAKIDRPLLVVEEPAEARRFFERVGFAQEGGRYVRRVERAG